METCPVTPGTPSGTPAAAKEVKKIFSLATSLSGLKDI